MSQKRENEKNLRRVRQAIIQGVSLLNLNAKQTRSANPFVQVWNKSSEVNQTQWGRETDTAQKEGCFNQPKQRKGSGVFTSVFSRACERSFITRRKASIPDLRAFTIEALPVL